MVPQSLPLPENPRKVLRQIEDGVLVCPLTRRRLSVEGPASLSVEGGGKTYGFLHGKVPVLVVDDAFALEYSKASGQMNDEYTVTHLKKQDRRINRVRRNDYSTEESIHAFAALFEVLGEDAVCVSIGGGLTRADARLLNLIIGPFPNVDIVAAAHVLPYGDASVDAIHWEAVFEHLRTPAVAAAEVSRVLKKVGRAFICTPFLQAYHGYPHHYQNFRLTGHANLFESDGLKVLESGTCVGPVYALRQMVTAFLAHYAPRPVNGLLRALWAGVSLVLAPLDIVLRKRANAHVLASTTYLLAVKP